VGLSVFAWSQFPKDHLAITFTGRDEPCVVIEPLDRVYLALMTSKDPLIRSLVLPEFVDLNVVLVIVDGVEVASV